MPPMENADSVKQENNGPDRSKDRLIELLADLLQSRTLDDIRMELKAIGKEIDFDRSPLFPDSGCKKDSVLSDIGQILNSQTVDRAKYYIKRLIKSLNEEKVGRINDINLNRWKEYSDVLTDSLWHLEKRDRSGAHNASYWGNFIPQIPYQLLTRFTKKGEWVLDTFLGSGTTLIECRRQGRNGIGVDLSPEAVRTSEENISKEENPMGVETHVINGDSSEIDYGSVLNNAGVGSVQFVIMHPPYWDIIKFSEDGRDLSNMESLEMFVGKMEKCAEKAREVLDDNRYLALVIGDKYSRGEWIPLGFRSMEAVMKTGFRLKSIVVKNFEQTRGKMSQQELWRYRALSGGFYVFKHEYIFLFEKN